MDDLAAKLKRRFDNWQTALNDSDQTVRQCQMKRAMFQADLEEAYRAGQLISLETHKALLAAANEAAAKVLLKRSLLALRDTTRNMSGQDVFACDGEYFTVAGLQESIERALSGEPT